MQTLSEFVRPKGRGLFSGAAVVFELFFPRTLRSGRMLFAAVLGGLPLLLVLAIGTLFELPPDSRRGPELFEFLGLTAYLQFLVPYISLLFGSSAVAEDVEGKTVVFLVTRPVKKGALAVGKWAVAAASTTLVISISLSLCFFLLSMKPEGEGLSDHWEIFRRYAVSCILGGLAYTALFTALGAWVKRALLIGLLITSVWEVAVANVPAPIRGATIMHYARTLLYHSGARFNDMTEVFGNEPESTLPSSGEAIAILLGAMVLGVGMAVAAVYTRQYSLDR